MPKKATDEEIKKAYADTKSVTLAAQKLGMTDRAIHYRLRQMGIGASTSTRRTQVATQILRDANAAGRMSINVQNGKVIVFSDAHYWPGYISTAHRALVKVCKEMKPRAVICNGDAFDGASISRYPRINWEKRPSVIDELRCVKERLGEVEEASKGAGLYWPLGNHDARFETFLAASAPQYEHVEGFHLKDHFPLWKPCWSVWINKDTVVKHRWKGGTHATRNNTLNSGKTVVTGHLHSLKVSPLTDYNGTRWGVDTGTLADPYGPQFEYTEDNPVDWRSGFIVLSFRDGELLRPQEVTVRKEGEIEYLGEIVNV
jgi:predicted phosphodiesterase